VNRPAALVTGAARRVGRAIALELARSGFDVALHYRSSVGEVREVEGAIAAMGRSVSVHGADLAELDQTLALAAEVRLRHPSLNLLVNNASLFTPVPFAELDATAWDRMQAVNTRAPFLLARDLLPCLRRAREPGGLIVNLCDIGADRPVSGYAHYSVSKAGLVMLTKAMAVELGPEVRAVGVSPGHVAWPEAWDEAERARQARRIPLRRVGEPEDVARLVRFLALEAAYVSGTVIPVDGGRAARY
jgi:pteridine reductase